MNFQGLLYPLADFFVLTFDLVMPMADMINWLCVVLGFVGMLFWLRLQGKYNQKAEQEGTLA